MKSITAIEFRSLHFVKIVKNYIFSVVYEKSKLFICSLYLWLNKIQVDDFNSENQNQMQNWITKNEDELLFLERLGC